MTSKTIAKSAICLALIGLGACAPKSRFEWGDYETSLYGYYKDTGQRGAYETALEKAIADGQKEGRVAPGLYAELGYMRLEDGNVAEAKVNFEQEMKLFPESSPFLTGVIGRMAPARTAEKGATS